MNKIYISGHNGFVGRALTNKLQNNNLICYSHSEKDLLDLKQVESIFEERPDTVFICSAIVGGIQANLSNQYKFLNENLIIQNNLINSCIKYNVKKVVYLGSSCIYPKDYKQPLKEEYLLHAPLEPTNEGYALAKITGLKMCEYANKIYDTNFICLMPCNIYGIGDNFDNDKSHVLSALIRKIYHAKKNNLPYFEVWGNGEQRREFLYVDDLADCMIWSVNNLQKTDTFYNVGTGIDISIKELAMKIMSIMDYNGYIKFDTTKPNGMMKKCLDVSKINSLGWKYKTSFDDGLKSTIKYYIEKITV